VRVCKTHAPPNVKLASSSVADLDPHDQRHLHPLRSGVVHCDQQQERGLWFAVVRTAVFQSSSCILMLHHGVSRHHGMVGGTCSGDHETEGVAHVLTRDEHTGHTITQGSFQVAN